MFAKEYISRTFRKKQQLVFVSSVYQLLQCLICLLTVSTKSQGVTSPSGKMLMLLVLLALVMHLENVFCK